MSLWEGNRMEKFFASVGDMLHYLFTLDLVTLPYTVAMLGVSCVMGYIAALIVIGLPCSLWEQFTKKKIKLGVEDKVTCIVAVCFAVLMFLGILYEKVT